MAILDAASNVVSSGVNSLISGAATALLQRTYMIQMNTPNRIPALLCVFDCVSSEQPSYTADITQHPVESGTEVTDHIQLRNPSLKIVGSISNTPLDLSTTAGNIVSGIQGLYAGGSFTSNLLSTTTTQATGIIGASILGKSSGSLKSEFTAAAADSVARSALLSAYQNKSIFDVVTRRQRFSNMAIQSLSFPRDSGTGKQLIFEIDMVQIRIVSTVSVDLGSVAASVQSSAVPPTNLGSQVSSQISPQAANSVMNSTLKKAFG